MEAYLDLLRNCRIFFTMKDGEILAFLKDSFARIVSFEKDESIFYVSKQPKYIKILISGSINICQDSSDGRRSIMAVFNKPGELFGEVYVFLENKCYEFNAIANTRSEVLLIPKLSMLDLNNYSKSYYAKLMMNMMAILSQKSYYLNKRIQILTSSSLRQKISKFLLENIDERQKVKLDISRDDMADLLHTARPSLSRELSRMKQEGLIDYRGKNFIVKDVDRLSEIY